MSLPLALPRRESRLPQISRRPFARVESHPSDQELYSYRMRPATKPTAKALERHIHACDRCAQRLAEIVWHDLWDRLSA